MIQIEREARLGERLRLEPHRSPATFECQDGHTAPVFGCVFCILVVRGLDFWHCGCGDERLPESTRCNMCGKARPARFENETAVINEAAAHRARKAMGQ